MRIFLLLSAFALSVCAEASESQPTFELSGSVSAWSQYVGPMYGPNISNGDVVVGGSLTLSHTPSGLFLGAASNRGQQLGEKSPGDEDLIIVGWSGALTDKLAAVVIYDALDIHTLPSKVDVHEVLVGFTYQASEKWSCGMRALVALNASAPSERGVGFLTTVTRHTPYVDVAYDQGSHDGLFGEESNLNSFSRIRLDRAYGRFDIQAGYQDGHTPLVKNAVWVRVAFNF